MTGERTGRVLVEMRRALGRMAGRVTSHGIAEAGAGIAVEVRQSTATEMVELQPGARQTDWRPTARVAVVEPPAAPSGANGADLASVTTVIGVDRALGAQDVTIPAPRCVITAPAVHTTVNSEVSLAIHSPSMRFGESRAVTTVVAFAPPSVWALPGAWTLPAKPPQAREGVRWLFASARVRDGLAAVLRAPLSRERLAPPSGVEAASAFAAERALLATGAGVPETDVALIGVFPQVPLWAAQYLSLGPGGSVLQILVRPGTTDRLGPPPVVTVILGRQRSTGKTLQAVRRETQGV